jgi:hypothetical protein
VQFIEQVIKMSNANFNIYGMGLGSDHLHYIGWTQRPLCEEQFILSDLVRDRSRAIARWVEQAGIDRLSIFEIESAASLEDARDTVQFWCQYYSMLGAQVMSDPS